MAARSASTALESAPAPAGPLLVEAIDDRASDDWNRYVGANAAASAYHVYEWRNVVRKAFGHPTYYLAAKDASGIRGILPLVRLKSALFGDFLVSMPYFNYGGVVANDEGTRQLLLDEAARLGASLGVSHMELRHDSNDLPSWPSRTDKVAMLLRLPASADAFDKSLPSKLRSQAKRPMREGAEFAHGGIELLDDFYAVFAENMRDLGTPVYAKKFFRTILATFPQQAWLGIVRLGGEPVAAAFLFEHRGVVEIPWASSLQRANKFGVNMFLYWNVLRRSADRGQATFDFGRSTLDSGTFRFKQQWGAEPKQLYWHYWLAKGGDLPRINPDNPKYQMAVAVWQRLPLAVTNLLGPHIVKNLP